MGSLLSVPASASTSVPTSSDWVNPERGLIREFPKIDPQIKVVSVVDRLQEPELPPKEIVYISLLAAVGEKLKKTPSEKKKSWANSTANTLLTLLEIHLPPQFNFYLEGVNMTKEVMAVYNQYAKSLTKK